MSDEPTAAPEGTGAEGAETTTEAQGGRGRPRPDAVVQRDQAVFDYLNTQRDEAGAPVGKTREEVAAALGIEGKQVYLSFYRLKRDGRITKGGAAGAQKWSVLSEQTQAVNA